MSENVTGKSSGFRLGAEDSTTVADEAVFGAATPLAGGADLAAAGIAAAVEKLELIAGDHEFIATAIAALAANLL